MDILTILAFVALAVAGIYLIVAAALYPRVRRQQLAAATNGNGHVVLTIADRAPHTDEPTPDRMRKLAGLCATIGERVFSERLDFSVESVAAVDRAIVKGWGDGHEAPERDVVHSFGAYLGEVMVRHTRGRWVSGFTDEEPAEVLFLAPGSEIDAVNFSPFRLAREKFEDPHGFDLAIAFTALQQRLKELHAV